MTMSTFIYMFTPCRRYPLMTVSELEAVRLSPILHTYGRVLELVNEALGLPEAGSARADSSSQSISLFGGEAGCDGEGVAAAPHGTQSVSESGASMVGSPFH